MTETPTSSGPNRDSRVDAIVVHYHSGGAVHELVEGLSTQSGVQVRILVVECGDDGSMGSLGNSEVVSVIDPGRNLGYCGGNNLGFEASDAPYVLVANPDTRPASARTVATLCDYLTSHGDVAAVAPVARTDEGRIAWASSEVDLAHAAAFLATTDVDEWPYGTAEAVLLPWLSGAFVLFRREALEDVGGFDERYFLVCEEVDWCLRARERGWGVALVKDSEIRHTGGKSFGSSAKATYYYGRNMFLLCRRHAEGTAWKSAWGSLILRPLARPRLWRSAVPLNALWAAIDALRGRYGPRPLRP